MKKDYRFRPLVEALEERWTPSSTHQYDGGGNLTVTFSEPLAGPIAIRETAANEITITEGPNTSGPLAVTADLTIKLPNADTGSFLSVDLNGLTLPGDLAVKAGNSLPPAGSNVFVDNGTIAGDLKITTKNGSDNVGLGTGYTPLGSLTVQGSVKIDTGGSHDSQVSDTVILGLGTFGASIAGDLSVKDANEFILNGTSSVSGDLCVNSGHKTGNVTISLEPGSTVGGDAELTTGNGAFSSRVFLSGSVTDDAKVRQGASPNTFFFTGTVGDDLTYEGGKGSDTAVIGGTVGGKFVANLGNGNDNLTFNLLAVVQGTSVKISGGKGNDSVDFIGLTAANAKLKVSLGNGSDTVNFAVVPVVLKAKLDGGNGADVFNVTDPIPYPITIKGFGSKPPKDKCRD